MSLNIKTANGLLEINTVTKGKIIAALGYSPADESKLPNIVEDESGELVVVDENNNVIARVDANGIHTTEVEAKGIMLGQTISEHTKDTTSHITSSERTKWNNKSDFSGAYDDLMGKPNIADDESDNLMIVDKDNNAIMKVDSEGVHTTEVELDGIKVRETLVEHTGDNTVHVTSAQKTYWNNKSEFSGVYDDLVNKPNITENDSEDLIVTDGNNTILKINANGLETTTVTAKQAIVGGVDIKSAIDNHLNKNDIHITAQERSIWNAKANQSDFESHKDNTNIHITSDERTIWNDKVSNAKHSEDLSSLKSELSEEIVAEKTEWVVRDGTNNNNVILRVNEAGLETTTVTAKNVIANGIDVNSQLDEHTTAINNAVTGASSALNTHNTSTTAHSDIRGLIGDLTSRLNALADSDDTTLDQLSEIVAYIKSNKGLIDAIATSKVSVSDIIDNLTSTNVTDKPLSAHQGVVLKGLIDVLQGALDTHATNTELHVTKALQDKWNTGVDTTLPDHINNTIPHVSVDDRIKWNDAVGSTQHINDLNALKAELSESIVSESTEWTVVDEQGNIALRVNDAGLETAVVTAKTIMATDSMSVNGINVGEKLDEHTVGIAARVKTADIVDNLTTSNKQKPLSANQGVVIKSLIDELDSEFDSHIADTKLHVTETKQIAWDKVISDLDSHKSDKNNPHGVTKAQVGLGNADNTSDMDKPVSNAQADAIADAKKAGTDAQNNLTTHINNKDNPHGVTKVQVGLSNVDNTSDVNKPVSTAQQAALNALKAELSEQIVSEAEKLTITDEDGNIIAYFDQSGLRVYNVITGDSSKAVDLNAALNNYILNINYADKLAFNTSSIYSTL